MPPNPFFRQAQGYPYLAYLVFKQHAQRLNQLQRHLFGQATHVVVRLDARCSSRRIMTGTLDHIGIECSLCQENNRAPLLFQPGSLLLKDANKLLADDLSLLFRINHIRKPRQEPPACIDYHEWNMQVTTECINHLFALTCTQAAVIDKDTVNLIPYSPIHD